MVEVMQRPLADGPLAVDLANTIWNNDGAEFDWLETPGALEQFCLDHGAPYGSKDEEMIRKSLASSRRLIRRLFDVLAGSENEDPAVLGIAIVNALAATRVRVHFEDTALHVRHVETRPTNTLATDALLNGLELGQHNADRLRCCSSETCILWFWDSSRGGRRRWCSMDRCGNRVKAQRHYQKSRNSGH